MPDETDTLTAETPASPPTEGAAADPRAEGEATPPPDGSRPEQQPPEGGERTGAEAEGGEAAGDGEGQDAPWFQTVDSEEALWESEPAQAFISQREESARTEGHKTGQSEAQRRMQGFLEDQRSKLVSIDKSADELLDGFRQLLQSEDVDVKALNDWKRQNGEVFDALSGLHQVMGRNAGRQQAINSLIAHSDELKDEFEPRLRNIFQFGLEDKTFFSDLREAMTKDATKEAYDKGAADMEKKINDRLAAEEKAGKRTQTKPPADVKSGGAAGGRSDEELLMDPTTPIEKLQEIRSRQKLAGG